MQGYAPTPPATRPARLVDVNLDIADAVPAVPAGVEMTSYNIGSDGMIRGIFADGIQRDWPDRAWPTSPTRWAWRRSATPRSASRRQLRHPAARRRRRGPSRRLIGGALEMSNVDLAAEFTNLIIAQRGFQASSRVITTSDQVLEELVNIKR